MQKDEKKDEFPEFLDKETKNIRAELLDSDARKWADRLGGKNISTHQVRRFFDEVKRYKMQLKLKKVSYSKLKPQIYMLKSKAKYASHKIGAMEEFYVFMEKAINQIKRGDEEEQKKRFEAFCDFFEAVYGFANFKKN